VAGDGTVVFAPKNAAGVGVFNPTDNSFSLVDISVTISTDYKFAGAATARDGRVVFAPLFALGVGMFDSTAPAGSQFTLVHVDKPQNANFVGAALAGDGRVVFPPIGGGGVGVFDPTDDTFTFVDISPTTARFHFAATLDDGRVVFAPYINPDAEEHGAGIFDATANRFTLVNTGTTSLDGITRRFSGAAVAPDGRVVFAPLSANGVGILKLPPCSCCETTMKSFGLHTNECKVVS
jgi:hypothetical protein